MKLPYNIFTFISQLGAENRAEQLAELFCGVFLTFYRADKVAESGGIGLIDDLALSSYDVICILGEIEEKLDVTVNEADIVDIRTVGEVISYLEGLKK